MNNTRKRRILLVEDEDNLRSMIKLNLEKEGYEVVDVDTGNKALTAFSGQSFNLVVLDVMLPEIDGFQICEKIRLKDTNLPILFLSAKNSAEDRVTGLKRGGDDYLTKPFNLEELLLRVNNLIKHGMKTEQRVRVHDVYEFGKNQINFNTFEGTGIKGDFTLTKKEAMLLKLLIDRKNEVVSRQHILETVWEYDVYPTTRTIDNFILNFRKRFEQDPKHPEYFHSIRGIGYKFINA